jgi:hypothetical protein
MPKRGQTCSPMPERGHTRAHARQDEPAVSRARRRHRLLQDRLHEAEQRQRQAWRCRDKAPCRRAIRHAAIFKIMADEAREAGRR